MSKESSFMEQIPSRRIEADWRFETAISAGLLSTKVKMPSSKDLREPWWTIGDQKLTASSIGWATADSVLRWHFVKAGRLPKNEKLSVRFIWMASTEIDQYTSRPTSFLEPQGGSLKAALDIARKYGVVPDSVLPFDPIKLYQGPAQIFFALAAQFKIASYFNLGKDLKNWKIWLANKGPILTRLEVDETWDNATSTKGVLDVYMPNTIRGGHAVALVGYTTKRLIVRNSWGTGWGDKGFGYASMAYAQAAFTEAYGVSI